MQLAFRAVSEDQPGPKWAGLFAEYWPGYRRWWSREGIEARPTYRDGLRAMREHMPEMVPLYESLCEQAGGGDLEARLRDAPDHRLPLPEALSIASDIARALDHAQQGPAPPRSHQA